MTELDELRTELETITHRLQQIRDLIDKADRDGIDREAP